MQWHALDLAGQQCQALANIVLNPYDPRRKYKEILD